jgi:hypothetical protein
MISGGCAGGGGSATARPMPGRASLTVTVRAEQKTGWRDPAAQGSDYAPAQLGLGPEYTTINYAALDEIVVWVQTDAPIESPAEKLRVDLATSPAALLVAGAGATWQISNSSPQAQSAFIRNDAGEIHDIGPVGAGATSEVSPKLTGPLELLVDSRPEPMARVFVAPSAAVRVVKTRQRVVFNDLPPGPVTVSCWHARLPGSTQRVVLQPDQNTHAQLVVTVNQLPKVR